MVISNGSAKKRGRPWGSKKKKSTPRHPHGGGRRRRRKTPTASRKSCIMELLKQPGTRKIDAMSRRKHAIRRDAGEHLTDRQREILGTAWNQYVNRCARTSLRHFARVHDIPFATWQREFRRGAVSPIARHGNRRTCPEHDVDRARASISEGRSNMGAPMKLTVGMAILFRHAVLKLGRSPYDARMMIREAMPDREVPCLKTFYNHIEAGDMGVLHGQTPYVRAGGEGRGSPRTRRGRSRAGGWSGTGRRRPRRRRSWGTSRWTR